MKLRPFPRLAADVSEVGLGCWQLGGGDWPSRSDDEARAVLTAAFDAGVRFFDTADVYGRGRSEERVGAFLAELGSAAREVVVATKLGRFPEPGWPDNFTAPVVRQHVDASLRRLGVERLDLVQLHCVPVAELERGELFATLGQLVDDGKLRAFGASVESTRAAKVCLAEPRCASLQVIFNVLRHTPIETIFARAAEQGVAIIVRLPLASGLLADRFRADASFPPDDHRAFNADGAAFHVGETFAGLRLVDGVRLVDELRASVPDGWTMAQFAQRWILDHEAVTTVITGASRSEQVVENVSAGARDPLPAASHAALSTWWRARVRPLVRGED